MFIEKRYFDFSGAFQTDQPGEFLNVLILSLFPCNFLAFFIKINFKVGICDPKWGIYVEIKNFLSEVHKFTSKLEF